jgi:hypothetical protein
MLVWGVSLQIDVPMRDFWVCLLGTGLDNFWSDVMAHECNEFSSRRVALISSSGFAKVFLTMSCNFLFSVHIPDPQRASLMTYICILWLLFLLALANGPVDRLRLGIDRN